MILILGGTGFVGAAFRRLFDAQATPYRVLSRRDADYTRADILAGVLRDARPAFLINCAGYTGRPNVDACELHKPECLFANAVLPGLIHRACASAGVPWGHVSSGCIYTGARPDGAGFREEDPPNFCFRHGPCSFYSGAKALGEELLDGAANCYVWRMRMPFSQRDQPRNYLSKLLRYDRLLDARNSLTELDEFVAAAWQCWRRRAPFGVYHVTNPGSVTTREVVELIRASDIARGKEFQFFASEAEFLRLAAKTPRSNCVLDSSKLARAGIALTPIRAALARALERWEPAQP